MHKPVSIKPSNSPVCYVSELRNIEGEGWDQDLIKQIFNEEEVELISSIPVSALGSKDRLILRHSPNGQYSIRFSYEFIRQLKQHSQNVVGYSIAAVEAKRLWNHVWDLKVKKKLQHYLWRCLTNTLPVLQNIQS